MLWETGKEAGIKKTKGFSMLIAYVDVNDITLLVANKSGITRSISNEVDGLLFGG